MLQVHTDYRWRVLGYSQRGASHVRQSLPNQDAMAHCIAEDGSPPVVLAVADGHGSAKNFRSDVGAQFAVATAVEVCQEFIEGMKGAEPSTVKSDAELRIPPRIFQRWRQRVAEHFEQNPFTDSELTRLAEQAGGAACERATRPEWLPVAYGATLLVAVVTSQFLICFQLGDGDILAVSDSPGVADRAIARDDSLIADETTSLCQDDGLRYVRYRFQLLQDSPPNMVLLSTDGYSNSFATPDAFLKAGADYLDMLHTEGADEVEKNLPVWLEETSRNGSGDDITVGIIYRSEPVVCRVKVVQTANETPDATASSELLLATKPTSDTLETAPVSPTAELVSAAVQLPAAPNRKIRLTKKLGIVASGALTGSILVFASTVAARMVAARMYSPRADAVQDVFITIRTVGSEILGRCPLRDAVIVWITMSVGAILGGILFLWASKRHCFTKARGNSQGTSA